jgi:hypothetical protein
MYAPYNEEYQVHELRLSMGTFIRRDACIIMISSLRPLHQHPPFTTPRSASPRALHHRPPSLSIPTSRCSKVEPSRPSHTILS